MEISSYLNFSSSLIRRISFSLNWGIAWNSHKITLPSNLCVKPFTMIAFNPKYSKTVLVDNLIEYSLTLKTKDSENMSFGQLFRPIYYLSRIWGLAPFSITTNSNGDIKKTRIRIRDVLFFLISIIIHLLFSFISHNRYKLIAKPNTLDLCVYLFEIFSFAYGTLLAIMSLCSRSKLIEMLKMFNSFDKKVCQKNASNFTI